MTSDTDGPLILHLSRASISPSFHQTNIFTHCRSDKTFQVFTIIKASPFHTPSFQQPWFQSPQRRSTFIAATYFP
jgi:hypothetical protein